jgi:hypothetical protein
MRLLAVVEDALNAPLETWQRNDATPREALLERALSQAQMT